MRVLSNLTNSGPNIILVILYSVLFYRLQAQSSGVAPKIKLNDGREIPALGIGTWLGFTKDVSTHC